MILETVVLITPSDLKQYHHHLQERFAVISKTVKLSEHNEDLRSLLRQYLNSSTNDELIIPPTRIVQASDLSKSNPEPEKMMVTLQNRV